MVDKTTPLPGFLLKERGNALRGQNPRPGNGISPLREVACLPGR